MDQQSPDELVAMVLDSQLQGWSRAVGGALLAALQGIQAFSTSVSSPGHHM